MSLWLRNVSKQGLFFGISVFVVAVVLSAASYWKTTHEKQDFVKITIAQAGDFFLYAPIYIAQDANIFRDSGLDVHIVSTGGDEKTWSAVVSGSADFGVSDPTFTMIAGQRGQEGRVIASIVNGVPFWGVATNPKVPPILHPNDLQGLTVGTFPAPSTAYTLQKKMFMEGGLPPRIKEGAFGTILAMLNAAAVDIALELEPNVSQAVKAGARVVYAMPEIYGDFAMTGLTATPAFLSSKPQLAEAVVCAIQRALDFSRKRPDDSLRILQKRFPEIDPEVARSAFERVVKANILPSTVITSEAAWNKAIDLRVEAQDLKNKAGSEKYNDTSFATKATANCRL